ncbi:MAG TPA: asparagine synthase-related protein, partial [Thermoanaerobaculia bacterium]
MFLLIAGPRSTEADGLLERMARELAGGEGPPRFWRDAERNAGAASLAPNFVPEDAFDVQPIADSECVFVCQARLDNREELLRELGIAGDAAIADSSLLAAAYARWGEACVQKLAGDFAFAAWHRDHGRVVAAVDPIGARRLFWMRIGSSIALATRAAVLLAHPEVSCEPDLESMASLFDAGVDRTSTPFAGVHSLPGGQMLVWRAGVPRVERWWQPESRPAVWYRDAREYVEEARELFTRAVSAQLRSSSPISSTLSGGLDSGSVTAMAARLLAARGERLTAYTSVPEARLTPSARENWEADDEPYAAAVAAAFDNIDHRLVAPSGRSVLDVLPSIHERSGAPSKSATNMLWLDGISASAAAAGSRVLLVGQQGNAAFSWTGAGAVWELASRGRLRAAGVQAHAEARERGTSVARVLGSEARRVLRAASGRTAGDDIRPPGLHFVRADRRKRRRGNEYAQPSGSRAFWASFATTPRHVWWPDPVTQWGIEWRDPTADRRLLERLLQYPQAAFRLGGVDRGLGRAIAGGLLPDRVRLRRTKGAQVPEAPSLIAAHADRYRAALERMRGSAGCREIFDFDE